MRIYVIATGVVFALLTLAHVWRIFVEPQLATDPWFMFFTLVAASLSVVAWLVARRAPQRK